MTPPTAAQEQIFETGTRVGECARISFRGAFSSIPSTGRSTRPSLNRKGMASGKKILYEPAFLYNGVLVRVDILQKSLRADGIL